MLIISNWNADKYTKITVKEFERANLILNSKNTLSLFFLDLYIF